MDKKRTFLGRLVYAMVMAAAAAAVALELRAPAGESFPEPETDPANELAAGAAGPSATPLAAVGALPEDLPAPEPTPPLLLGSPPPHDESAQLLRQHTDGWHTPLPAVLPKPTYAPAMIAFGIVFLALGVVTQWPLSVVGAVLFVVALAKWIGELLHD
jgi:hypothetical protein